MKNKVIGIIGGMGPEASQYFYGLLTKKAQKEFGATKNDQFPEIIIDSVPVPDFITDTEQLNIARVMLRERVKQLSKLPISFFCMACNTGHVLIDDLREVTDRPFISLLEEVPELIKKSGYSKVGLMATPMTIKLGLYNKPLNKKGIEVITPSAKQQAMLGKVIKETVAGKNQEENSVTVQKIARELLDGGAEAILETCTEIPLIFPKQHLVPVYDSLEILANAVLTRYYK